MNSAIDDYSISSLKLVVLDEIHLVDDGHRGVSSSTPSLPFPSVLTMGDELLDLKYLLELIAAKLLCLDNAVQIVGMSATLTVSFFLCACTPLPNSDLTRHDRILHC